MRIPLRFGNSNNRVPSGLLRSDRTKKCVLSEYGDCLNILYIIYAVNSTPLDP